MKLSLTRNKSRDQFQKKVSSKTKNQEQKKETIKIGQNKNSFLQEDLPIGTKIGGVKNKSLKNQKQQKGKRFDHRITKIHQIKQLPQKDEKSKIKNKSRKQSQHIPNIINNTDNLIADQNENSKTERSYKSNLINDSTTIQSSKINKLQALQYQESQIQSIEDAQSCLISQRKQSRLKTQQDIDRHHKQCWKAFHNRTKSSLLQNFIDDDNPSQTKSNIFYVLQKLQSELETNKSNILIDYQTQIAHLQSHINDLQCQLKQKQFFMIKLSNSQKFKQSKIYQTQLKALKSVIANLQNRIKSLEQERKYLHQKLQAMIQAIELNQQKINLQQTKCEQLATLNVKQSQIIIDKDSIISNLKKDIQNDKIFKKQLQAKNTFFQTRLNQLENQNQKLKRQNKLSNLLRRTQRSYIKSQFSENIPNKSFNQCTIIQKIHQIKSQLPLQQQRNDRLINMNQRNQQPFQLFVKNAKDNTQAQKALVLKLVILYQNNLLQNIIHYYDPNSLAVKGNSKFLQIVQLKINSFTIFETDQRFIAPQFINTGQNIINEQATIVWNLALMIDYIMNQQSFFKQTSEILTFKSGYSMKKDSEKEMQELLRKMLHIEPQSRPKIKQIKEFLSKI